LNAALWLFGENLGAEELGYGDHVKGIPGDASPKTGLRMTVY